MKLKNTHILLIVISIFLLISIGSVCAADNAGINPDAQLTDSGVDFTVSDDETPDDVTPEK